jgi:hypothetical protein
MDETETNEQTKILQASVDCVWNYERGVHVRNWKLPVTMLAQAIK